MDIKYTPMQPLKNTICICENGLIELLVKVKICNLTLENITNQNTLHTYLEILPIHIEEKQRKTLKKPRTKNTKWSKKKIVSEIRARQRKGMSLASSAVQGENRSMHEAAIKHFGSWEHAINTLGIKYDDIREDVDTMAYWGKKYEELLGGIIKEIDGNFTKGYTYYLKPDFVLNKVWIDAKLSYWTGSIPETIEKYEPFCDTLIIIYLRGYKNIDKMITEKTRILSVYMYIKKLPEERQNYYLSILDDYYEKADNQEKKE